MLSRCLSLAIVFFCLNICWALPRLSGQNEQIHSSGNLRWEKSDADVSLGVADKEAVAHYAFQNLSGAPLTILALSTSCQCVRATAGKKVYAPQDKGEITVTLTRTANQPAETNGVVMVETDSAIDPTTVLKLNVKVSTAPVGSLEPTSLTWGMDEGQTPKLVKLVLPKTGPSVKDVSATSTDPRVVIAQVRCVCVGQEYEITATPAPDIKRSTQAKIVICVDYANGQSGKLLSVVTIN